VDPSLEGLSDRAAPCASGARVDGDYCLRPSIDTPVRDTPLRYPCDPMLSWPLARRWPSLWAGYACDFRLSTDVRQLSYVLHQPDLIATPHGDRERLGHLVKAVAYGRPIRQDMSELAAWDGFYGILGSAAGALIGLQFVVMTLVAQRPVVRAAEAGAAFATPTVVHFASALLLSALLRAPWHAIEPAADLWGLIGLSGAAYAVIVARRIRAQSVYRPQFEDWLFHALLPLVAYAVLALSALAASSHTREALFGVGAAALLLLFIGIHNSWDNVAYHVFFNRPDPRS